MTRRFWTAPQKQSILKQLDQTGMTVSEVARRNGIAPSMLFNWRKETSGSRREASMEDSVSLEANEFRDSIELINRLLARAEDLVAGLNTGQRDVYNSRNGFRAVSSAVCELLQLKCQFREKLNSAKTKEKEFSIDPFEEVSRDPQLRRLAELATVELAKFKIANRSNENTPS